MIESIAKENFGRIHPLRVGHILHKKLMVKNIVEIKSVGKNRVRVQLRSLKDANDLLKNKNLDLEQLRAFIPNHILETKGVIKGVDTFFEDNYIMENIKSTNKVVGIKRFLKRVVKEENTSVFVKKQTVLLTFEGNILPAEVSIDSVMFPVEMYYGRVTQCYKCLNYGHISKQCKSEENLCISCGKTKKDNVEHKCTVREIYCVNCKNSSHRSNSKICPFFVKQQGIKKIMIDNKITFKEAKQFYDNSYSNILSNNRFSLISDLNDYNTNFPPLSNSNQSCSQPARQVPKNNITTLSQPVASTSRNNQYNNKKRKHITSPPPNLMFPFVFGPSTPLSPNNTLHTGNENRIRKNISEQKELVDTFACYFMKLLQKFDSFEELKNMQIDTLKKCLIEIVQLSQLQNNGSNK